MSAEPAVGYGVGWGMENKIAFLKSREFEILGEEDKGLLYFQKKACNLFFTWLVFVKIKVLSWGHNVFFCLFDGVSRHFRQYFSYIVAVSLIRGGNRRTRRKPQTYRKLLTNITI